jgi:hypothetical protein
MSIAGHVSREMLDSHIRLESRRRALESLETEPYPHGVHQEAAVQRPS